MTCKIIVGPDAMHVERHGFRSETRALTADDGPDQIKGYASDLWESIRPLVSWAVWTRHRLHMARQRRLASLVSTAWPGPYYQGPRPDLISQKPWAQSKHGEWAMLPHGVASRLIRSK